MSFESLHFEALPDLPEVRPGDDLAAQLLDAARARGMALENGVLLVCQKVVSKAEGRIVRFADVEPGDEALRIAREDDKDPRHVEVVLRETKRIVRRAHGVMICETHHGFVCANAGVDLSNAPGDEVAVLLPEDSDASARRLREGLLAGGARPPLGVVVTDTFGRPWREGHVDTAIGCAGMSPLLDLRGTPDLRGRDLAVTVQAPADALAAAAGLLMRKDSGIAAVFARGFPVEGDAPLSSSLRDPATDLFR
ncbi:MAG: coenzyme F420-0:L-glutamate ligase [Myxococcota bacterium]|nr:coenzyme F420-0:L-glutamate ligase [Myxococcota bacterium]